MHLHRFKTFKGTHRKIKTLKSIESNPIRPKDVAAATFMATATTTPELFTNVISTFIAESDMGIGTIIGSLMFNTLGVAAVAAMAAKAVNCSVLSSEFLSMYINFSQLAASSIGMVAHNAGLHFVQHKHLCFGRFFLGHNNNIDRIVHYGRHVLSLFRNIVQ